MIINRKRYPIIALNFMFDTQNHEFVMNILDTYYMNISTLSRDYFNSIVNDIKQDLINFDFTQNSVINIIKPNNYLVLYKESDGYICYSQNTGICKFKLEYIKNNIKEFKNVSIKGKGLTAKFGKIYIIPNRIKLMLEMEIFNAKAKALGAIALKYDINISDKLIITGILDGYNEYNQLIIPNIAHAVAEQAFSNCYNIEKVIIGNNVEAIYSNAFSYCKNLKQLILGKNLIVIDNNAFLRCNSLEIVKWNEKLEHIGPYAFCDTNIRELKLGSNVNIIHGYAFSLCKNLRIIDLSKTKLKIFEEGTLRNTTLTHLILPGSIQFINFSKFPELDSIEKLYIPYNKDIEFIGGDISSERNIRIYLEECVLRYKLSEIPIDKLKEIYNKT